MKGQKIVVKEDFGCYRMEARENGKGIVIDYETREGVYRDVVQLDFVEYKEKYYLFGSTPEGGCWGFPISLKKYNSLSKEEKFKWFLDRSFNI